MNNRFFNRVLNWLSGGQLNQLRETNVQVCEVATSLMREKVFDMQLIEAQKNHIKQIKYELCVLHKRIPELEQRAGCTVKYLEELEDLKFRLARYQKLDELMHARLREPAKSFGAIGLLSTGYKQSNDTTK
jgi:hypothetical protein